MTSVRRAEARVARVRKPYADCRRDFSRSHAARAVRRLSRAIVTNDVAEIPDVYDLWEEQADEKWWVTQGRLLESFFDPPVTSPALTFRLPLQVAA